MLGIDISVSIFTTGGGVRGAAFLLLGNEWNGFAIDFTDNSYAIQKQSVSGGEALLGAGPYTTENGLGLDFTDNSYAVRS